MMKRFIFSILLLGAGMLSASGQPFIWCNPISDGIDPRGIRDCQVFREGDTWYLTGTAYPFWLKQENATGELNPGVPLYKSSDLLHWQFVRYLIERPGPDKWYYRRFWAPEIHHIGEKFYLTFNCRNDELGYDGQYCGYAVSDCVEGPYKVVTEEGPLTIGNDLTLFPEEDGTVWAFWDISHEEGIFAAPINLEACRFTEDPVNVLLPGEKGAWDEVGLEGSCVFKRNGKYYLLYSSWTMGYEIGYAMADDIRGPYVKGKGNPFYGAVDPMVAFRRGFAVPADTENPFVQVGHNQVFTGPDGNLWLSCHGNTKANREEPMLVIDPIHFSAEGEILTTTPSYVPREVATVSEKKPDLLAGIEDVRIFKGDGQIAYRDPAVLYHEGTFYLWFSVMRTERDSVFSYVGQSRSRDLAHWTEPELLTERNQDKDFCSPGNVVRCGDKWVMCLQTYPRPGYVKSQMPRYGTQAARLYTMTSDDLVHWTAPALLKVKGDDVPEEEMGRMLDPYLIQDLDTPGKWWCFYKQRGVSRSWSYDLVHWTFDGFSQAGENVCILRDGTEYVMFHSPTNGIGVKRSADLVHWGPDIAVLTLGQNNWPWAKGRISAGAVIDCRMVDGVGKYLMVFHGSGPLPESEGDFDKNTSIGLAWSDNLTDWEWPANK